MKHRGRQRSKPEGLPPRSRFEGWAAIRYSRMIARDGAKSERNLRERGFGFVAVIEVFARPVLEFEDARRDYGERRIIAIGEYGGAILAVVYTWRGSVRRIISLRIANRRERNAYRTHVAGGSDEA